MTRRFTALLGALLLVISACGGDSDGGNDDGGGGDSTNTAGVDVCALLSDAELQSAVGQAPESKETEPAGPFTGCNWGTGFLIVQIAPAVTLITAPFEAESDCPSAGIGEDSIVCLGGLKFLANGIHVSISSLDNLTETQLKDVASTLLPKIEGI